MSFRLRKGRYECIFRLVMGLHLEDFSLKYHHVGNRHAALLTHLSDTVPQCKTFVIFLWWRSLLNFEPLQLGRSTIVDLALRLEVVAVFAVFAFVAAILLGAF